MMNGLELLDATAGGHSHSKVTSMTFAPFLGYKIQSTNHNVGLGNRFISVNVIKNRYGVNNSVIPLLFLGEVGYYEELPRKAEEFDYDTLHKYKKIYV
jgi:hypothetical protein